MIVTTHHSQQDLIKYTQPNLTPSSNFLSQFTSWAKVWMYSSSSSNTSITVSSSSTEKKITRKRKTSSVSSSSSQEKREMDIRSRIHYYDPSQQQQQQQQQSPQLLTQRDLSNLYRATCQKLRPNPSSQARRLGNILHVRKLWDTLEPKLFQELSQQAHYLPPTKRSPPFNPEKPGSVYLPRRSKRHIMVLNHFTRPKRSTFSSTTIVYTSQNNIIKMLSLDSHIKKEEEHKEEEDDDDVPLGALLLPSSLAPPPSSASIRNNYILIPPEPSYTRR